MPAPIPESSSPVPQYQPITISTVDRAVRDWFDLTVDAHVEDAAHKRSKVPVVFSAGERWATSRTRKGIRDQNGVLVLPIISVRRTGIEMDQSKQALGVQTPNLTISRQISPKTNLIQDNNLNRQPSQAEAKKAAVFEITTIPFPSRAVLTYELVVQAQYSKQMNVIIEKVLRELDLQKSFVAPFDNPKKHSLNGEPFEDRKLLQGPYVVGFFESAANDTGNFEEFTDQERIVRYSTTVTVPCSLQLDPGGEKPALTTFRTAYKVDFSTETSHFSDDMSELDAIFKRGR